MQTTDGEALPPVHEAWLPREHSLYRPRHGSRQRFALVAAAVFFAAPVLAYAVGLRPGQFENRALTEFPNPDQGWSFFTRLVPWASDHLSFREEAVHVADGVSRSVFGEPPNLDKPRQDGPIRTDSRPTRDFPRVIEGKDGWLYLGAEVASHCEPRVPLSDTMARLRKLKDGVEASGRRFAVVIAPDKTTVAPAHLPDGMVGADCLRASTDEFWRTVAGERYIIDVRGDLRAFEQKLGSPVYGPIDAHWSDEGGLAAAKRLADHLDPGLTDGWVIEPAAEWTVPADLPPLIGRTGQTSGRHYSVKPDGVRDRARLVPGDFTAPLNLSTATGPGTYPERTALLGDSFTFRSLRYLAASFQDMTVLTHNSVVKDEGRTTGEILADHRAVTIEVAERTLVAGEFGVLAPGVVENIVDELARRPVR